MVRCALRDLRVAACDRERDLRLGRNLRQKVSHTHTTTTIIITITKMHHLYEYMPIYFVKCDYSSPVSLDMNELS